MFHSVGRSTSCSFGMMSYLWAEGQTDSPCAALLASRRPEDQERRMHLIDLISNYWCESIWTDASANTERPPSTCMVRTKIVLDHKACQRVSPVEDEEVIEVDEETTTKDDDPCGTKLKKNRNQARDCKAK